MRSKDFEEKIIVPEGVQATMDGKKITAKGPKGEVTRIFNSPVFSFGIQGQEITFKAAIYTKNGKKMIGTYKAHLYNMFRGVTEGHNYELKVCSGHFPMNVDCKGQDFQVKNFLGEKVPRKLKITEDVEVKVDADKVTVAGINKEHVAQAAASIEQLTRRSNFDRRVFQDGIYIVNKDGKKIK